MFSRHLAARLLAPLAIMLALVAAVLVLTAQGREEIEDAHGRSRAAEQVVLELSELRSLSRSLQRDALNLATESSRAEIRFIEKKFSGRFEAMTARLTAAQPQIAGLGPQARDYLQTQTRVLEALRATADRAMAGDREGALALFRGRVRGAERRASAIADALIDGQIAAAARLDQTAHKVEEAAQVRLTWGAMFLGLLAVLSASWVLRKVVLRPLREIELAMERLADGDTATMTPHAGRADEIGRMARGIERFREAAQERDRLRAEARAADERRLAAARAEEEGRRAALEAQRRALLDELAARLGGDMGSVATRLRASSKALAATSTELERRAQAAAGDVGEVDKAAGSAAQGALGVAAAVDEFAATLSAMDEQTRAAARNADTAVARSQAAAAAVARLRGDADRIGSVMGLIAGVARQSRTLALNATIEASRAGEAGRGFAVVAAEMKALADKTAQATAEVERQVGSVQALTRGADEAIEAIGRAMEDIGGNTSFMATAVGQQASAGQALNRTVATTAGAIETVSGRLSGLAQAAHELDRLAAEVRADAAGAEETAAATEAALGRFLERLRAA